MAKFIVDEEVAMASIEKWQSGELTKALFRDVFSKSQEVKCCDTCGNGNDPLSTHNIEGKCYCKRSRKYEKPTHYCAAWKEKRKNASACGRPNWPSGESEFRTSLDEII